MLARMRAHKLRAVAGGLALAGLVAFGAGATHAHDFGDPGAAERICAPAAAAPPALDCWACALARSPAAPVVVCVGSAPAARSELHDPDAAGPVCQETGLSHQVRGPPARR